jgi:hypothetical protein
MHRTARSLHPGRELRYRLSLTLLESRRTMTTSELVASLEAVDFPIRGRPSKTVADALRSEIARGRVTRLDRARYRSGHIPPRTIRWMRAEVIAATERRAAETAAAFQRQLP